MAKNISDQPVISRRRLEELATLFKDGLMEDDPGEAMVYFRKVCKMTDEELEFFGIDSSGRDIHGDCDCEHCNNGVFDDLDRLRCKVKKCNPEYNV